VSRWRRSRRWALDGVADVAAIKLLSGSPVGVADGLCVQLGQGERGRHRFLAGDGRAELLADVFAEVLELRDV
jgi:hypothetical protein